MPEIHIVYAEKDKPIVCQPAMVAARGEPITWRIYSANPRVKSVEVDFGGDDFFDNTKPTTKRRVPLKNGQADFYGHVPDYDPLKAPKIAKYTIRAYSSATQGKEIEELTIDPVIITPQP